ncbi:thiamine pyrophosphate-dependent enzyme [Tateyamaria armeniaca]|uniref:2-oxoglutarate dehydrogenase E1 component n=1 Tax=Tateyamaria armeniaca TaxID=2518930 RepID=A0ABW8UMP9_9RHOB
MDRVSIVHDNFLARVAARDLPEVKPQGLNADASRALFEHQCLTRALDIVSREMQKAGQGFYTIGSSGHEGMAAVAHALRPDDIAFLHYRDGAFQVARAAQRGQDMCRDMLLSYACAADDPTSGGRHKVLGSRDLFIPPQTSTIASHLPKALGAAYGIGLARRNRPDAAILPSDGIAVASFGDASLNHSTAQGAINATGWTSVQGVPLPLLLICEDNGIGISTKTPAGWVAASLAHRPGLTYFAGDGCDLWDAYRAASAAASFVRTHRKPAVLHLRTVRLYGHAGADVATSYLPRAEVEADEANDPLLHTAAGLIGQGETPDTLLAIYESALARTRAEAADVAQAAPLSGADAVMAAIIPPERTHTQTNGPDADTRAQTFGSDLAQMDTPQPMSRLINWALTDLMLTHPETVIMGEDVGRKGGVYGVTQKLLGRFGPSRVIDTLLDEQSILGLAIGMAHNGFVPMPEIQFLAYLHNAEDQIRGEAATLPFFSNGQWANPMVLRIAGLGYQKGFGGHFHNDNALAVLRDIPALILACPSDGAEAVKMLRECHRLAREENRLCVFVEPIALYSMRDVHPGDGAWMRTYPAPDQRIALGEVGVEGEGDLAIVTFANGRYLAAQAQVPNARLIDLRWLAPLPIDSLLRAVKGCKHILVVDETRRSGGVAEGVMTALFEAGHRQIARYTADDSFIATGRAYADTLPSEAGIRMAAAELISAK